MESNTLIRRSVESSTLLLVFLLAACNRNETAAPATAAAPAPAQAAPAPAATAQPAGSDYYVEGEVPPPRDETREPSPGPDYVWVGGYWGYNGGRHDWVRGHWERPPHAHAEWVAPRWERHDRGHVFVRGYWR